MLKKIYKKLLKQKEQEEMVNVNDEWRWRKFSWRNKFAKL